MRATSASTVLPQCDRRIHSRRAASGAQARRDGHQGQQDNGIKERRRIRRGDLKKQARHHAS